MQKIITPLLITVAILGSTWTFSTTFQKTFGRNTSIEVKGVSERKIKSDLVKWDIACRVEAPTLEEAYKTLADHSEQIINYLEKQGVARDRIRISPTNVYDYRKKIVANNHVTESNEIEKYQVNKTFTIESKEVDAITDITNKLDALMGQGINVRTSSLEYFCTNLEPLKAELLGEATLNGYLRAQQLAKATRSQVGGLRHARQGVFQITAENSSSTSDYGIYDTSSLMKSVKVIANVSFAIE